MKKSILFLLLAAVSCGGQNGIQMQWEKVLMDGSRTGVKAVNYTNSSEALGSVEDGAYHAPNGNVFTCGSTLQMAERMIAVQPQVHYLKEVIAYNEKDLWRGSPESPLSDLFADRLRVAGEQVFGKPMDLAIANHGGIRCNLQKGDVILDDIYSMFPFVNYLVYVKIRGDKVYELLSRLAKGGFAPISGATVVIKDKQLVSVEIGGQPLDPEKVYNMATIDFLLSSGDRMNIGRSAERVYYSKVLVKEFMLDYVKGLTAEGKSLDYEMDGRVKIEK